MQATIESWACRAMNGPEGAAFIFSVQVAAILRLSWGINKWGRLSEAFYH
jgi:hypothetical protein